MKPSKPNPKKSKEMKCIKTGQTNLNFSSHKLSISEYTEIEDGVV